jgi:hypothetical protein
MRRISCRCAAFYVASVLSGADVEGVQCQLVENVWLSDVEFTRMYLLRLHSSCHDDKTLRAGPTHSAMTGEGARRTPPWSGSLERRCTQEQRTSIVSVRSPVAAIRMKRAGRGRQHCRSQVIRKRLPVAAAVEEPCESRYSLCPSETSSEF